jgi:LysM repeat protein
MNDTTPPYADESARSETASPTNRSARVALLAVVLAAIAIAMGAVATVLVLRTAAESAESHTATTNLASQVGSVVSKQAAVGLQLSSSADKAEGALQAVTRQNQALRLLSQEDSSLRVEAQRLATLAANLAARVEALAEQLKTLQSDFTVATNKLMRPAPVVVRSETSKPRPSESSGGDSGKIHTVKSGDTFEKIANKHGTTIEALMQANPGMDPRRLQIDQKLRLP